MTELLVAAWALPLFGAVVCWAFGPQLARNAGWVGSAAVALSFLALVASFGAAVTEGGVHVPLVTWTRGFAVGLSLDPLSLLWALIITGVGGAIHLYSIGYMWNDRAIARFFAYLNIFVFSMLTLVLSDDLLGLLVGWGLVGLASYFLIGFWFSRPAAVAAARKAFVINVFGDVGIMFGLFVLFAATGSIAYADVFAKVSSLGQTTIFVACVALFVGCAAKSAQVPLHTWLPDAMEGPTPVSALIHAATMVTAGVYLIARFAPLWSASPAAAELTGIVGGLTMVLGALLGVAQWDIKRILAYSTMSQIGYMIMGVGVGAYQAGVLHFFTHAFFKAELFLSAGIVIHALHDEQDVRKMGGLRERTPFAFWAMLIGTLAIIGFPGFSGYFSKDAIIYGTLERGHPVLYVAGAVTAGLTAYYMFRMLFLTFFGPYRGEAGNAALGITRDAPRHRDENLGHAHAPDWLTNAPVALLAVLAIVAGYVAVGGERSPWNRFLAPLFGGAPSASANAAPVSETASTLLVLSLVAFGIVVAYLRYGSPAAQLSAFERIARESLGRPAVFEQAFYFDAVIETLIVGPARALGTFFDRVVDPHVIDAGVRDVALGAGELGWLVRALQNGLVRSYALSLAIGAACFIVYFAAVGSAR